MGVVTEAVDDLGLPRLSDFGLPDTAWMAGIVFFVIALVAILSWKFLKVAYSLLYGSWVRSLLTASFGFGFGFYAWSARSGLWAAITLLLFIPVTAEAVIAQKKAAEES